MAERAHTLVRYDGPALTFHEMDVRDLAPALLALGELCEVANEALNQERASVRVLVRVDIEQQCFQFQLEVVQTVYENLTAFLDAESVQDAKLILEWLGLVSGGLAVTVGGLFGLYKKLFGKETAAIRSVEATASDNSVVYQIVGDHNTIIVPREVHRIAQDPRAFPAAKRVLAPLQKNGYERLEFVADGRVTQYFTACEARAIIQTPQDIIVTKGDREHVSTTRASVGVRKPAFEGSSKWNIVYKKSVDAKMADHEWLENFQAGRIILLPGWHLLVDLEERVQVDKNGMPVGEAVYTIVKVHGVEQPPQQAFFVDSPS